MGTVFKAVQELVPVVIVPKQLRQWSLLNGDSLGVWGLLIFPGDTGKEGGVRPGKWELVVSPKS